MGTDPRRNQEIWRNAMSGWQGNRGTRHERGYGNEWVKLRLIILSRDRYLCQTCERAGRTRQADAVDHVTPKALGGTDDHDNLSSICNECHKTKTDQEASDVHARNAGRSIGADGWPTNDRPIKRWPYSIPRGVMPSAIPVVLVCGPPASGKTTYAKANSRPCDIIVDLDELRVSAGGEMWARDPTVDRKAFALRNNIIHSLARQTEGVCYLIVTALSKDERWNWCKALGNVTLAVMPATEAQCIERIRAEPARAKAAVSQIEAVRAWHRVN